MQHLAPNPTESRPKFSIEVPRPGKPPLIAADPRATRALVALMDTHALIGGAASHYGGPAALAELMSALHAVVLEESEAQGKQYFELFNLINDAGHCENGLYALKANYGWAGVTFAELKTFRAIGSRLTGHGESHLFPEGVLLSNGPLGSSLPQAQGLAVADRLNGVSRTTVVTISDGACMEGEAREALASIPGMAKQGRLAPFVMIISDNNTKLSGRIDKDAFSMAPTFASLEAMGWRVLNVQNGNVMEACVESISTALKEATKDPTRPVAIHARTVKGIGLKKAADSASGGHGFPLKVVSELAGMLTEIYSPEPVPKVLQSWCDEVAHESAPVRKPPITLPEHWKTTEKVQVGIAKAMIEARGRDWPVVSVTSDLPGSTGVADFHKKYPQFSFDVGVAEANMVSVAAGLSKFGLIPIVDTFAQFGVTKGALPLVMANLSQAPVIAVFSHTGFQDAADGASHQALSYFSMVCSIPHTQVYALSCSEEAHSLMLQAIDDFRRQRERHRVPEQMIFFLGRENFPKQFSVNTSTYVLGRSQVFEAAEPLKPRCAILAFGPMVQEALIAQQLLAQDGVGVDVINASIVNIPDLATAVPTLNRCGMRLLTIEDHQVVGGAGAIWVQALAQELARDGQKFAALKCIGVPGEFGRSAYVAADLYQKYKLDSESIAVAVQSLL